MENKKMTKRDCFKEILEIVKGNEDLTNFINHELELLDKKNSKSAMTKTQTENENIKKIIVNALTEIGTPVTITELQKKCVDLENYSNQKISALLKQLVDNEIVKKVVEKRVTRFYI